MLNPLRSIVESLDIGLLKFKQSPVILPYDQKPLATIIKNNDNAC